MNAVLGFAQLLEMDGDLVDDQLENVSEILKAGRHLLDLIDEVLDVTRIEAGKYDFRIVEVDVSNVISESLMLVDAMTERYNVTIENRVDDSEALMISADVKAFKQVIVNLLSNAIKYNRINGKVTVSCISEAENRLRVNVADTGYGICTELQDRIFEPFDRLGRESEIEGSGIGLAVVKGLVEGMGGRVGLDSVEGKGTTFWVEFALATHIEDSNLPLASGE